MSPDDSASTAQSRLRTLQIIAGALVSGVVLFGLVVAIITMQRQGAAAPAAGSGGPVSTVAPGAAVDVLRYVAIGLLIVGTISALMFIRQAATQTARDFRGRSDLEDPAVQDALFGQFFMSRIIGLALVESAALLSIVVTLIGGDMTDLAVAAIAVLIMLLVLFPTGGRWTRFIDRVISDSERPIGER